MKTTLHYITQHTGMTNQWPTYSSIPKKEKNKKTKQNKTEPDSANLNPEAGHLESSELFIHNSLDPLNIGHFPSVNH